MFIGIHRGCLFEYGYNNEHRHFNAKSTVAIGSVFWFQRSPRSQLAVRTELVSNCGSPTLPMHAENIELRPFGRSSLVGLYADMVIDRDLPRISRTEVLFERCKERLAPHSCTRFITWRFRKDSCAQLEDKKALWSNLMEFDPPLTCPFRKVYSMNTLRNAKHFF